MLEVWREGKPDKNETTEIVSVSNCLYTVYIQRRSRGTWEVDAQ